MFERTPRLRDLRAVTYSSRRDWVNIFASMTREGFLQLPETDRDNLLSDLRTVVTIGDTRSFRDSMGCLVRGAAAPHTALAQGLITRFTYQPQPQTPHDRIRRLLVPALREEARKRGLAFSGKTKRFQLERLLIGAGWTGEVTE